LTKKYDVLEIAGIEKLVRKGTDVIYYCTTEELYRLIKTAHSGIGHDLNLKKFQSFYL
jgi:DNA-binding transcriptional ArsR family regulator